MVDAGGVDGVGRQGADMQRMASMPEELLEELLDQWAQFVAGYAKDAINAQDIFWFVKSNVSLTKRNVLNVQNYAYF